MEIVRLFIEHDADLTVLSTKWGNALNAALQSGNQEIMRIIINERYKILASSWYFNLLLVYLTNRHSNESDSSALVLQDPRFEYWLSKHKHVEKIASLDLLSFESSLFSILGSGNHDVIELIVSKEADLRDVMPGGLAFLLLTVLIGTLDVVKALVAGGADAKAESADGETVFHAAAVNTSEDILQYLLTVCQDSGRPDRLGRTALHVAALCGTKTKMQYLLIAGGDAAAADHDGFTIYHYGAQGSHNNIDLPALRSPLSDGVHINSKTFEGLTLLTWQQKLAC